MGTMELRALLDGENRFAAVQIVGERKRERYSGS